MPASRSTSSDGWSPPIRPRPAASTSCRSLFERRGEELARAVAVARREPGYGPGVRALLERIVASPILPAMRSRLEDIADAERAHLTRRMAATQGLVTRADTYTEWLGWLGVLVGLGAVGLAILAWRAFIDGRAGAARGRGGGLARARPRTGGAGAHPRAQRRQCRGSSRRRPSAPPPRRNCARSRRWRRSAS